MPARDLTDWKRQPEGFFARQTRGFHDGGSPAYMSYTNMHEAAFASIGGKETIATMKICLPDLGQTGFALNAAHVLRALWLREQHFPLDNALSPWPDFSEVDWWTLTAGQRWTNYTKTKFDRGKARRGTALRLKQRRNSWPRAYERFRPTSSSIDEADVEHASA